MYPRPRHGTRPFSGSGGRSRHPARVLFGCEHHTRARPTFGRQLERPTAARPNGVAARLHGVSRTGTCQTRVMTQQTRQMSESALLQLRRAHQSLLNAEVDVQDIRTAQAVLLHAAGRFDEYTAPHDCLMEAHELLVDSLAYAEDRVHRLALQCDELVTARE